MNIEEDGWDGIRCDVCGCYATDPEGHALVEDWSTLEEEAQLYDGWFIVRGAIHICEVCRDKIEGGEIAVKLQVISKEAK